MRPSANQPRISGVVAIVRLGLEPPDEILHALVDGGVTMVEVTLGTPRADTTISRWRESNMVAIGAGSVRSVADVHRAVHAGAEFLVTPTTSPPLLESAAAAGVPVACGAATPTEIDLAWQFGADAVKVFPADTLGGPAYIAALQGPMPEVPLLPTGGVDQEAARKYAQLGCRGVGVGSALVSSAVVADRRWSWLREAATDLTEAWHAGGAP